MLELLKGLQVAKIKSFTTVKNKNFRKNGEKNGEEKEKERREKRKEKKAFQIVSETKSG